MSFVLQLATSWTVYDCATCHMPLALPDDFERRARSEGFTFHCPMGHPQVFADNTEAKLKRQLEQKQREVDAEKKRREWAEVSEREARESANRQFRRVTAYKGAVKKMRQRAAVGVCPCCKRSFENVRRHMATKHPRFGARRGKV